jgi:hypothetical protein
MAHGSIRIILLVFGVVSCKESGRKEPAAVGETFSFGKRWGGVEWECPVLDAQDLGKKLTDREAKVSLVPTLPVDHFERLHVKITNRGTNAATMSPTVLSISADNPDVIYARADVNQAQTNAYLDGSVTPPFKGSNPVAPGESREYWEITQVPDAMPRTVFQLGTDSDYARIVVVLRK